MKYKIGDTVSFKSLEGHIIMGKICYVDNIYKTYKVKNIKDGNYGTIYNVPENDIDLICSKDSME